MAFVQDSGQCPWSPTRLRLACGLEQPPVATYLDLHARRFAERSPVKTFLLLSEAIDRCNFGQDKPAVSAALRRVSADVLVIGVPEDLLFPWALQVELHRELQAAGGTSSLWKLDSEFGHDAFLADLGVLAEADPSADLDGHDAAAKLSILAYRAFGAWFRPDAFPVRGIRELYPADCDLAETMGFRIRLIARAARVSSSLDLAVEPVLLPDWHLLASVEEEYNAIYLKCASSGDLSLFGMGAGAMPTATAVLGDLIDLAQANTVRWPAPQPISLVRVGGRAEPPPRRQAGSGRFVAGLFDHVGGQALRGEVRSHFVITGEYCIFLRSRPARALQPWGRLLIKRREADEPNYFIEYSHCFAGRGVWR